jgi:hypothetical protein
VTDPAHGRAGHGITVDNEDVGDFLAHEFSIQRFSDGAQAGNKISV